MAASSSPLTGMGPVAFTHSTRGQLSIPLTAFVLEGSTVTLATEWQTDITGADATILLALVQGKVSSGELAPPAAQPPRPAIVFSAAAAGAPGNDIAVTVSATGPSVVTASLTLEAVETDVYPALASATKAAFAIGATSQPTPADPPVGTGLVQVVAGSVAPGSTLPTPATQTLTLSTAGTQKAVTKTGDATLFEVKPRAAVSGATPPIKVKVTRDPSGTTFTVTASYDSGSVALADYAALSSLPQPLSVVVSAASPPGGYALPAGGTVSLSGGGPGIPASGVAYTS